MDDDDGQRLIQHLRLCHEMMLQLVTIIEAMWDHLQFEEELPIEDAKRLERLIAVIKNATRDRNN
jgi:hypothetical protein